MIIGPMFSGKSTELIRHIRMMKVLKKDYLVVTHSLDTRYDTDHVVSHNMDKEKCVSCNRLMSLLNSQNHNIDQVETVFVEEGQFFEDIVDFVYEIVENLNKHLVIAYLTSDFNRRPFPHLGQLIALSDNVIQLSALCMKCRDGTQAPFTYCRTQDAAGYGNILVGSNDVYESVCRKHYRTLHGLV